MNILLGLTGSVATVLAEKLVTELQKFGEVRIVATKMSTPFIPFGELNGPFYNVKKYRDEDEWSWKIEPTPEQKGRYAVSETRWRYEKGDEVLHIELRKWADIFIIAPCSANSLAKIANGICDNLLTCVAKVWDFDKPMILALAMNTLMYQHPTTKEHLNKIGTWGVSIVHPQTKTLACGDTGIGAMADISKITEVINKAVQWNFPLDAPELYYPRVKGIPVGNHPGAFGFKRKHDIHSGVDLYCEEKTPVYAVENGTVVAIGPFTGPSCGFPWWLDTKCVAIEGISGVVNYGEIEPAMEIVENKRIRRGELVGFVIPVLKPGKERPDIPGHSRFMLHLELYKKGTRQVWRGWQLNDPKQPDELLDPTEKLRAARNAPLSILTIQNDEESKV